MTNEDIKAIAKQLLLSRTSLVSSVPFFSRLILHLNIGVADCGTAYTDMENIVFDPDFAKRLSKEEIDFVFLHEVLHCVLNHCIRGKGLNNLIYNIACDIVVNSIALDILGLKTFSVDGSEVMHLTVNGAEGREYTAEDIYHMLFKAGKDELNNFCKLNGININSSSDKASGKGSGNSTEELSAYDMLSDLQKDPTVDSHSQWDNIDKPELLKDKWNSRIKHVASAGRDGRGIPNSLKRYIKDLQEQTAVNWRQILHDLIKHNRSDFSYSVPDRRFDSDIIMPSFQDDIYGSSVNNLWFLVDTSGSVTEKELSEVYGEILNCIRQMDNFSAKISFFDTAVSDPVEFTDEESLLSITPVGGGGTSFHSIFNYLKKNLSSEDTPEMIIILTDGFAGFPNESVAMDIPVIWIISNDFIQAPWGKTINIS